MDTVEDTDKELERKDNEIEFLKYKLGLPDFKVFEEMKKLGLHKMSAKRKGDMIMDRKKNSVNNHKNIKIKKQ